MIVRKTGESVFFYVFLLQKAINDLAKYMKTLKLEVCMYPPGINNRKIKIKKTFQGHFLGLLWHIFRSTVEVTIHEWRIRSRWLWQELEKHVSLSREVLESEIRIVVLIFLNIIALTWIINQKFIIFSLPPNYAHGYDLEMKFNPNKNPDLAGITRLDSERRTEEDNEKKKKEEGRVIINELNKLISTQDERCQKDKKDGRCTELCIKNEEEIIKKMQKEERQAWLKYLSGRPTLLGPQPSKDISCPKDTKGAQKSPNKGKHMDEDCCPDPDEWPKPGCRYSAAGLALMLKGPSSKK